LVNGRTTDKNIIWTNPATKKLESRGAKELIADEPTRMARKFTRKVNTNNCHC
jgi:hypothetical protein